ncbi:MAG TPA: alpha-amylase family protein [Chthoniobacterales bacterium]
MFPEDYFRQIHLDFHTSPFIPAIGAAFDPEEFADTLAEARVNSITLFAKCHHGHLYYDTPSPARHPHLGENLLERQIDALKSRGIATPIYLSVMCDEFAADTHPEWVVLTPEGTRAYRKPLSGDIFSWQILDMSSPYADYLADQIAEVMQKFSPVDGIFLDMCWDQQSVSVWAKAGMDRAGLDAGDEADRKTYARQVVHGYMERYTTLIASFQRDVPVWFNSRPLLQLKDEIKYLRHVEIEALPTGQWGYSYLPTYIRYVKTLGKPFTAMTGRFHKSWADFGGLRAVPSLLYDCAQGLAHGARCSIGDQLHPSGKLDKGAYEVIGTVYRHVEACEPFVRDAVSPKEIAVLIRQQSHDDRVYAGVMRALKELHYQFDFVTEDTPWEDYKVVVIPESIIPDESLKSRLDAYGVKGGRVLHVSVDGAEPSPFTVTYLRFPEPLRGALPDSDHAFYERGVRLTPQNGETALATIVEPYFERTWRHFSSHAQTPARLEASPYAAALATENTVRIALPVFRAYAEHGNIPARHLVDIALRHLLPNPMLRIQAPAYVDAVVGLKPGLTVVHLISFIPEKRARLLEVVEDAVPARNLHLDVHVPGPVKSVTLQPAGKPLRFTEGSHRVSIPLEIIEGHEMVVIAT